MIKRKELKKQAKHSLREHLGVWILLCILLMVLNGEQLFTSPLVEFRVTDAPVSTGTQTSLSDFSNQFAGVLYNLSIDDDEAGELLVQEDIARQEAQSADNQVLGRSRGVLSGVINRATSGSYLLSIGIGIRSVVGSGTVASALLVLGGLALLFLYRFFVVHPANAAVYRMFLEGQHYPVIRFNRALFFIRTRSWLNVSVGMFRVSLYQTLWNLTLVGGIIKHYSYWLVPYLLAENPKLKSKDAILLSRRMMDGHKWECFKLEYSFLLWELLSVFTFGLIKLLFLRPYEHATFCAYYAAVRARAKAQNIPGTEQLNDEFLFAPPEDALLQEAYRDVLRDDAALEPPVIPDTLGARLRYYLLRFGGVKLINSKTEQAYERQQALEQQIFFEEEALEGKVYPARLTPLAKDANTRSALSLSPLRCYSFWSLVVVFYGLSLFGWLWEVALHMVQTGEFVNRGVLHGPWLPIYGGGSALILILLYRFRKNPVQEFVAILVLCGGLEYLTSVVLELAYGEKWWDYTGYFLNLNGRICAEGLLAFGIGGIVIVYFLAPLLDNWLQQVPQKRLIAICLGITLLFAVDQIYSHFSPNLGEGVTTITDRRVGITQEVSLQQADAATPLPTVKKID